MYASFDRDAFKEKVLLPSMGIHMYMKNQDSTLRLQRKNFRLKAPFVTDDICNCTSKQE